jgi:hypothetical protein
VRGPARSDNFCHVNHVSRPATSAEIDQFCQIDGWAHIRSTDHYFWEKVLPGGEVLQTHRSWSENKTLGQNVFSVILRCQLKVDRDTFWEVLSTGVPASRPTPQEEPPQVIPGWVLCGLLKQGVPETDVLRMSPAEAEALLAGKWSSPPDQSG